MGNLATVVPRHQHGLCMKFKLDNRDHSIFIYPVFNVGFKIAKYDHVLILAMLFKSLSNELNGMKFQRVGGSSNPLL